MVKKAEADAHQVLYRKYRSRTFSDVVGQEHVTTTLENAIKSENISHAYLFSGPRGVGKTTVARILAHAVNELQYDNSTGSSNEVDIVEIDAASNRRIDDIRDLRSKVNIAPSRLKYKVYIIDEVHMLTKESFNALLKTLEEPPAHVVFILATTEAYKLPATIISRTQHFRFKAIAEKAIVEHLSHIAKEESIDITKPALELVAHHVNGGMRDGLGLLDQLSGVAKKLDLPTVELFMGLAANESITRLIDSVHSHDTVAVLDQYSSLIDSGASPQRLVEQLYEEIRKRLLANPKDTSLVPLMHEMLTTQNSHDSKLALESTLIKHSIDDIGAQKPETKPSKPKKTPTVATPITTDTMTEPLPITEQATNSHAPKATADTKPTKEHKPESNSLNLSDKIWQDIINYIRRSNSTLAGLLSQVMADLTDNTLTIICPYSFHVKRLETAKYQSVISEACMLHVKQDITIKVTQDSARFKNSALTNSKTGQSDSMNESIKELQKIMGGEIINV